MQQCWCEALGKFLITSWIIEMMNGNLSGIENSQPGDAEYFEKSNLECPLKLQMQCVWGEVHYALKNKAKMEIKCCLKISTRMWKWGFIMWWISSHVSTCNVCITMTISRKVFKWNWFEIRKSIWDFFVCLNCVWKTLKLKFVQFWEQKN